MFYDLEKIASVGPLFNILESCRRVKQDVKHHPEGDVFTHSVQALMLAMRETTDIDLIFAAMLHDVGKKVESHGHEKFSVEILQGLISDKTAWLIENHMRFWTFVLGDMKKLSKVTLLTENPWFSDLALLCRWDKMARNPNSVIDYDRIVIIERLKTYQQNQKPHIEPHTNEKGVTENDL